MDFLLHSVGVGKKMIAHAIQQKFIRTRGGECAIIRSRLITPYSATGSAVPPKGNRADEAERKLP